MINPMDPAQRLAGDAAADAAVRAALDAAGESDPYRLLPELRAFDAAPGWVQEWTDFAEPLPGWARADAVAAGYPDPITAGQLVFQKYDLDIATALFCASLPWAYGDAPGVAVLAHISELAEADHVARRIAETGRWLVAVGAEGGLEPDADGYRMTRLVRLLHAVVRAGLTPDWDIAHDGVPVNQQDLLQTVLSFTTVVFDALDSLGVVVCESDQRAYLHLWAVIAHLLGVEGAEQICDLAQVRKWTVACSEQHRRSRPGKYLTAVLIREMELAMPWGLRKLPQAVVRRLIGARQAALLGVGPSGVWAPAFEGLAVLDSVLARTLGVRVLQAPSRLVGRSLIRMWIDRTIAEDAPPRYAFDPDKLVKWKIKTDPLRRTLTKRGLARQIRYRIRRRRLPPLARYISGAKPSRVIAAS
jgi:hypothetical protein